MGQAKNRQRELEKMSGKMQIEEVNKNALLEALRHVISAANKSVGADCVLYSLVGAEFLRRRGYLAKSIVGSAAWRVGPGDSDVISHASEINGKYFAPEGAKAGLFHCWIQIDENVPPYRSIVDFTTWQFIKKAKELDAADGGFTKVEFCPDFLWVNAKNKDMLSPHGVLNSFNSGVYSYVPKEKWESDIFSNEALEDANYLASAAELCYRKIVMGENINVLGVVDGQIIPTDENCSLNLKAAVKIF